VTNSLPVSRRTFLQTTGAVAATAALTAKSYARVIGANDRIRVGFVGAGGQGLANINTVHDLEKSNNVEGIVVADCWKTRAEEGAGVFGSAKAVSDYRHVLDNKEVDYVTIAVPEHSHAGVTIAAFEAGKPVYCEKPMTHTIEQGLAVQKKQKETGLPLQVGVQAMSDDSYGAAAVAIRQGVLGKVVQAQIEYVRRYDTQGPWRVPALDPKMAKPRDLDWDTWLGVAPKIDWNPHHFFEWRNYSQYSGGICTDLFIHRITRIMKACDLQYPRRVVGMGGIWQWPDGRDLPDNFEMICEYPRGMTVYVLGTMSNRVGLDHVIRGYRGTMYFSDKGWVVRNKDGKILEQYAEKKPHEDMHNHHTNLHNHLRNGEPLNCGIDLGMAAVVAVNMANESWRTSQMMAWDAEHEQMVPANTLKLSHEPDPSALPKVAG
jgi:predicted dehydrogenase